MRHAARALAALALPFAVPAVPAHAALMTGDDLHAACSAAEPSTTYAQDIARCHAYVAGAYDDFMAAREQDRKPSCEPAGMSPSQVIDTVIKAMRDQPAFDKGSAGNLVRVAIVTAFPNCSVASDKSAEAQRR